MIVGGGGGVSGWARCSAGGGVSVWGGGGVRRVVAELRMGGWRLAAGAVVWWRLIGLQWLSSGSTRHIAKVNTFGGHTFTELIHRLAASWRDAAVDGARWLQTLCGSVPP